MTDHTQQQLLFGHLLPGLSQARGTPKEEPDSQRIPNKRPRLRGGSGRGRAERLPADGSVEELVNLMAKIVLQHEDELNLHQLDKSFTLYLTQAPPAGILVQLFQVSQQWHMERDRKPQEVHGSLRVVVFNLMMQELRQRTLNLKNSEAAVKTAQDLGILKGEMLPYEKWDKTKKEVVIDPARNPVGLDEVLATLEEIPRLVSSTTLHKFHATRKLKEEPEEDQRAVFLLEVGLREKEADRLHSLLRNLQDNAVWRLVGGQFRGPNLQRHGLSALLQKKLQAK